jgi:hypothetical protein
MVAKSGDGGQTWEVKHQKVNGEVLLAVGILGEKVVYASGTNGVMLWSGDGGETWKSWEAGSERVDDLFFSDSSHGIRRTLTSVQITGDGGDHWLDVSLTRTDDSGGPFSKILGMATVDATHLAMLLSRTQGENIFLSTQDGGATWKPVHIDNTHANTLFTHDGRYWAFGMEIVDRQNHGGYSVPLVLYSPDGLQWIHGTKAPTEFGSCTSQGCVLYDGSIADLYNEKPHYSTFPADGTLTPKWAISRGSICTVGLSLRCAEVSPSENLPPRPVSNRPITVGPGLNLSNPPSGCLICTLNPFPLKKQFLAQVPVTVNMPGQQPRQMLAPGLQVILEVRYRVRPDGTVDGVQVSSAPRKEIESPLLQDIGQWVFEPPRGIPSPEGQKINVLVHCMAFASNDEAACTAMIPPPATNPSSSAPSTRPISPPINRIRIGGSIQASQLITKVTPEIPEELKNDPAASGTVVLHAIIAKDGTVQEMQYVSGPTSLAKVAMDAVRQWTYKPTTLQGQPVEVDTTIAVAFPSPENK